MRTAEPLQVYISVVTLGEIRKGIECCDDAAKKATLEAWLTNNQRKELQKHERGGYESLVEIPITKREAMNRSSLLGRREKQRRSRKMHTNQVHKIPWAQRTSFASAIVEGKEAPYTATSPER